MANSEKYYNNSDPFKISVIVTTYNTAEYLPVCLESVITNTYKNLEIILVDDGSTDNSLEICRNYAAHDSRIKIIAQKNSGVSIARNNGLAKIFGGGGVHFMDGDDYVSRDFYARLAEALERDGSDMVSCSFYDEKTGRLDSPLPLLHIGLLGKLSANAGWLRGAWSFLFRTDFMRQHEELRFDSEIYFGEDCLLIVKALYYAEKVSTAPDAVYYHRFNMDSVSCPGGDKKNDFIRKSQILVGDLLDDFAKEKNIPSVVWETHKRGNYRLQTSLITSLFGEQPGKNIELEPRHQRLLFRVLKKLLRFFKLFINMGK